MKRRILGVALLAALMGTGVAEAGGTSKTKLTIKPKQDSITYQRAGTSIRGELAAPAGTSVAGREVKLYEKRYPYRKSTLSDTTQTNAQGAYKFGGVNPAYNSRYRVVVGDPDLSVRSREALVVVYPRSKVRTKATRKGVAISSFELHYSGDLPLSLGGRRLYWYFNRVGTPRFKVRDRTSTIQSGRGILIGRSHFDLPKGSYRFSVSYCFEVPHKRDIGLGPPSRNRGCPRSYPASNRTVARAGDSPTMRLSPG